MKQNRIHRGKLPYVKQLIKELNRYIAAHVYLYYRYHKKRITKKKIIEIFNTTRYKLDNAIDKLLSI